MVDAAKLKVGDKVHYIGFPGDVPQNGIVKEIPDNMVNVVRVVYNCAGDWKNYMNYTSALTSVKDLHKGWSH